MIVVEPAAEVITSRTDSQSGVHALKVRHLRAFLTKARSAVGLRGEVSVLLATDAALRALNRDYRKKDKTTDVLSFPVCDFPGDAPKQAGDLAISVEAAERQADDHGHSLHVELKILMLHGLLHLAGYDHETDNGQMARKESALRKELGLPAGLIQRSAGPAVKKKEASKARSRGR